MDKFWEIFDERLELVLQRHLCADMTDLKGTPSDVAPILWQYGALARLKKGETIRQASCMADIQQFLLVMQDFVNVLII